MLSPFASAIFHSRLDRVKSKMPCCDRVVGYLGTKLCGTSIWISPWPATQPAGALVNVPWPAKKIRMGSPWLMSAFANAEIAKMILSRVAAASSKTVMSAFGPHFSLMYATTSSASLTAPCRGVIIVCAYLLMPITSAARRG